MSQSGTKYSFLPFHFGLESEDAEKPYKCDVCDMSFAVFGNFSYHKRVHLGKESYSCEVCEMAFTVYGNMSCHRRTHASVRPGFYENYPHHDIKSYHIDDGYFGDERHPGENGKLRELDKGNQINCIKGPEMRRKFGNRDKVNHSVAPFTCSECNASIYSSKEYNEHIFGHELKATEPTGISYICFKCDESFKLPRELIGHIKGAHQNGSL